MQDASDFYHVAPDPIKDSVRVNDDRPQTRSQFITWATNERALCNSLRSVLDFSKETVGDLD
jgi:hypothetical protein